MSVYKTNRREFLTGLGGVAMTSTLSTAAYGFSLSRPTSIGLSYYSHKSAPAMKNLKFNGSEWVRYSLRGQAQVGGIPYHNRFNDNLDFDLTWWDILEDQAYRGSFSISVKDLTIFKRGGAASLSIISGAGGDILATTVPQEFADASSNNDPNVFAIGRQYPDIVVAEACAAKISNSDPLVVKLKEIFETENKNGEQYQSELRVREVFLTENPNYTPKCEG